ncbi:MAG: glutamate--tRNA ligase [Magnetococcales bacterium]|nr:glutamate--tRNA ligase [Magnetococcales bacterium]
MTMRTRFAPSPTGFLHIGGARTALFCYLHARHSGGVWALRIEDTDGERSNQAAVDAIFAGLDWLGLTPDEPPVWQSANVARHLAAAEQLLATGRAYRCYCSRERLDALREQQRQAQIKPRYDGHCLRLTASDTAALAADQPSVIRFKTPTTGEVMWQDWIQGPIRIQNEELDDLVLVRSDGTPTYNLAVVVDDHDMEINHIIRGEDHISNTPRQIHLFQALGWPVPEYAHMPLLHGPDGAKLSKRHGAVSVLQYRDDGFLPEAVNNYLVRLGWSHGDQEIFSLSEMVELFDVRQVGRSATIFNGSKLLWLNGHYLRQATPQRLVPEMLYQLQRAGIPEPQRDWLLAVIPSLQQRCKTVVEMVEVGRFYFVDSVQPYHEAAAAKHLTAAILPALTDLVEQLTQLPPSAWQAADLEQLVRQVVAAQALKGMGQLAQPLRVALTGRDTSPSIFEIMVLLGRERSLARMHSCLVWMTQIS